MKIGLISDTHDDIESIDEAVKIINDREPVVVLHAGDLISPFSAMRFKALKPPLKAVYGNNDGERSGLRSKLIELGGSIDDFLELMLDGKRIALYHGTLNSVLSSLLSSGRYDAVVSGHTHQVFSRWNGGTLHLNPGEACGYLSAKRTLGFLELDSMELEIIEF